MVVVLVIVGVVVLLAVTVVSLALAQASFARDTKTDAEALLTGKTSEMRVILESDLRELPEPVQRYLRYTGVVGRQMVSTVRLKYTGAMRLSPSSPWKPIRAVEYYGVSRPGFVWLGQASVMPLLSVTARDSYINGRGRMLIKILSTFTLGDAQGFETDYSALMRYLNEMTWFPTAFLNENIVWEAIDGSSARVTITDGRLTASAVLSFDEKGAVTSFVGERYHEVDGKFVKDTWATPIKSYSEFDGMRLPARGEATWKMPSGDFCYFRAELTEIQYNPLEIYSR